MKLQQRTSGKRVVFFLWLGYNLSGVAGAATNSSRVRPAGASGIHEYGRLGLAAAAPMNAVALNLSRPPRVASTLGEHEPGQHHLARPGSSRSPRIAEANLTRLQKSQNAHASVATLSPRLRRIAPTSGKHESIFQIGLASARTNSIGLRANSTRRLRIADTSGNHRIGLSSARANSTRHLRLADTSDNHRIAVRQTFAKLTSEAHRVHSAQSSHSSHSPVLMQRSATRFRKGFHGTFHGLSSAEPRNVEEIPLIWGVPKMVWVILADVVAMGIFLGCTVLAAWADRAVQEQKLQSPSPYPPDPMLLAAARMASPGQPPPSLTPSFTYLKTQKPAAPQFV